MMMVYYSKSLQIEIDQGKQCLGSESRRVPNTNLPIAVSQRSLGQGNFRQQCQVTVRRVLSAREAHLSHSNPCFYWGSVT